MSPKNRWALVPVLCGTLTGLLGAGEFDARLYELKEGSLLRDDCLNCDRAPIVEPLRGTLVLTRLPVKIRGELFDVTAVDFRSAADPPREVRVKGTGRYHRDTGFQTMTLDLEVNGTSGVQLLSGEGAPEAEWPLLDVSSTEDGQRDPLHVYTLRIVAAPVTESVLYELVPDPGDFSGSIFIDDCRICGRPTIPVPVVGSFLLTLVEGGPNPIWTYRVDGMDLRSTREGSDYRITGEGAYRQGGEVALTQEMSLVLKVNEDAGAVMVSPRGPFPEGVKFPDIDVQLEHENPQSEVHVYSLHLVARPAGKPASPLFIRGDSNSDASVDISDAVHMLLWLFTGGGPPACADAADVNDDESQDLSDPVSLLDFLFRGGSVPPAPGPNTCGSSGSASTGCDSFPPCS